MATSGYSYTPGKYDPVKQIDIVPEQEKSNQRILASEEQFLDQMVERDEDIVDKTRSEWESLTNLSSKFASWMEEKAEKDKTKKLQKGAYLATLRPASIEEINALAAKEQNLHNSHIEIDKIATKIQEETGNFQLAEDFRSLSGWERYAYVKASLERSSANYQDYKNNKRESANVTINGVKYGYIGDETKGIVAATKEEHFRALDAKVRFDFVEQYVGVNEELLATVVAPKIKSVDDAELSEVLEANDDRAKNLKKEQQLDYIETGITTNAADSRLFADRWIQDNVGLYGSLKNSRLAFRDHVYKLVETGKISLFDAQNMIREKLYHTGDKKEVDLEHYAEFKGFADELIQANTKFRSKENKDKEFELEARTEAILKEINASGTQLSLEQKQNYLKQRKKEFPNIPLNDNEKAFLYGYRDDDVMRDELNQKVATFKTITERDLRGASPEVRKEFQQHLAPDDAQEFISIASLPEFENQKVVSLVEEAVGLTGALDTKGMEYFALYQVIEAQYKLEYDSAIALGNPPEKAMALAYSHVATLVNTDGWVETNSKYKSEDRDDVYEKNFVMSDKQLSENKMSYATEVLGAPEEQQEELQKWAANGGKGPVPFYYRRLASDHDIIPRELAWRQAEVLGFEGQWDEKDFNEFEVPTSMVTFFLNKPTINGKKRFDIDVNAFDVDFEEDVHPYEENEDID